MHCEVAPMSSDELPRWLEMPYIDFLADPSTPIDNPVTTAIKNECKNNASSTNSVYWVKADIGGAFPSPVASVKYTKHPTEYDVLNHKSHFCFDPKRQMIFNQKRHKAVGGREHIYMTDLLVLEEWRGENAAIKLVEWGIDLSRKERMDIYLEAEEHLEAFYETPLCGFCAVGRFTVDIDGEQQSFVCMIRKHSS